MYLRVNRDVAGFDSPIKKVAVTLLFIKGPQVAGWVCNYRGVLDTLHLTDDNILAVWNQFLDKFEQQFMDSYILKFEELTQQAGYTVGSPEIMQYFLLEIPKGELL